MILCLCLLCLVYNFENAHFTYVWFLMGKGPSAWCAFEVWSNARKGEEATLKTEVFKKIKTVFSCQEIITNNYSQ